MLLRATTRRAIPRTVRIRASACRPELRIMWITVSGAKRWKSSRYCSRVLRSPKIISTPLKRSRRPTSMKDSDLVLALLELADERSTDETGAADYQKSHSEIITV